MSDLIRLRVNGITPILSLIDSKTSLISIHVW